MSLALGRWVLPPSASSDLSLPRATRFSSLNFLPKQSFRRRGIHGGGCPVLVKTRSSCCSNALRRFGRLYFRGRSLAAARLEDGGFDLGGDGSDGGKVDNGGGGGGGGGGRGGGGGGGVDGGDWRLDGFPLWWWWQRRKQPTSPSLEKLKHIIPVEIVWLPEGRPVKEMSGEQGWLHFLGGVKRRGEGILNAILEAMLTPLVFLAIGIADLKYRRSYVPEPIRFFRHFDDVMLITMELIMGTAVLLTTLLVWWMWPRNDGDSAGEDGADQLQDPEVGDGEGDDL